MPRPKKHRKVCCLPESNMFGPVPARIAKGSAVVINVDEYETMRLIDYEGMSQQECAKSMNVARATVQRMYAMLRHKIADAFVNGRLVRIEGGDYELYNDEERIYRFGSCKKHRSVYMNKNNLEKKDEDSNAG